MRVALTTERPKMHKVGPHTTKNGGKPCQGEEKAYLRLFFSFCAMSVINDVHGPVVKSIQDRKFWSLQHLKKNQNPDSGSWTKGPTIWNAYCARWQQNNSSHPSSFTTGPWRHHHHNGFLSHCPLMLRNRRRGDDAPGHGCVAAGGGDTNGDCE